MLGVAPVAIAAAKLLPAEEKKLEFYKPPAGEPVKVRLFPPAGGQALKHPAKKKYAWQRNATYKEGDIVIISGLGPYPETYRVTVAGIAGANELAKDTEKRA